jgi:hypothetical protein
MFIFVVVIFKTNWSMTDRQRIEQLELIMVEFGTKHDEHSAKQ